MFCRFRCLLVSVLARFGDIGSVLWVSELLVTDFGVGRIGDVGTVCLPVSGVSVLRFS